MTQINWRFRIFLVSYHINFNIFLIKKQRIYALEDGGVAGGFMFAHFFTLQFCLKVMKVSMYRPLKPIPFVLIFAILLISIKPRGSEQSLWEIRAKVGKGGTNDHWETKKRKMSSLRNCHRVRRRARLLNSAQYGHQDLNIKLKNQIKPQHQIP